MAKQQGLIYGLVVSFVCFLLVSCSASVSLHGSYTQGNELLLVQVKGSVGNTQGRQLAVSGDLRHSMANLVILPTALGLDGALGQSDSLIEGRNSCESANSNRNSHSY